MTLHIGVKAAVDGSETCTADRLDDCASVVVRAVGFGLMFVEHWFVEDALFRGHLRACCGSKPKVRGNPNPLRKAVSKCALLAMTSKSASVHGKHMLPHRK